MSFSRVWSRIRKGRLVQVLLVYLGISWVVVQVVGDLRDMLELPQWIGPVAIILLGIGLIIILATAWVQSHPLVDAREAAEEVPGSWELDLPEVVASVRRGRLPHLTWSRALVGGLVSFSLLIGAAGLYVLVRGGGDVFRPSQALAAEAPDGIAVLPFTVRGDAVEDWREGMVDLLSTALDGAGGLRAIASRTVLARWHESVPAATSPDASVALDVARHVGARYALLGSAVSIGPSVRLAVDVYELDGEEARRLGPPIQVEGHPDSVLVLVDRLGLRTLALVLRESGADLPPVELASVTTASLPALKSYLEGETLFRHGDFPAAAAAYERALATDTLFALAHWRLSQALGWNESVASPRGRDASRRAVELADRLPPREALLARASVRVSQNDPSGIALLEDAVKRYPDDAEAWYQLGDAKYHLNAALVAWDDIEPAFERAVMLAPRMAPYRIHLMEGAFRSHADSALIRAGLDDLERLAPNTRLTRRFQAAEELAFGDTAGHAALVTELLDPANGNLGGQVSSDLSHPRFAEVKEQLARRAYPHAPANIRQLIVRDLGFSLMFSRGGIAEGLEEFRDPLIEPREWGETVLETYLFGIPIAPDLLARAEAVTDGSGESTFVVAAYAATRQQWDAHAHGVAVLRTRADSLDAAGDTVAARRTRADAQLLEGFGMWRRGQADQAARVMDAARMQMPNQVDLARWWLGQLHLEAGRWTEAEPYFDSFMRYVPDPLATYYLAQIHERTGRRERARALYAFFAEHWAGADAALQPRVDDARQRLSTLSDDAGR